LAQALIARAGVRPVGFIGRVLDLHPIVREGVQHSLAAHEVRFIEADAALAAARLRTGSQAAWRQQLLDTAALQR
jgi:glucosamine kinase